ncbi:GNAT family N-acetyltransferase [Marinivivus vitaminiproducens]|uniref:GNAT family N-acetyltransferase n=1 Tax=Marinivivus vitaminiproducens TaxID=3035935 RepID=UPI00279BC8F7|nr:GNAT family N-acetyltransferase [Geminicoccaceae bacterium SCSIO 64248]
MSIRIEPISAADYDAWLPLYRGYAAFYKVPMPEDTSRRLFGWLVDPSHVMEGRLARDEAGKVVGLAHFRAMPRPLAAAEIGFLDDLFVASDVRGGGVGRALLLHLADVARERGWAKIRWITATDNGRARLLYDQVATATAWVTYEMASSQST